MEELTGIGKLDRERLSAVLRATRGTVTVSDAADALNLPRAAAAKLLARWARGGWLSRVRRGLYVPVPLESRTADGPLEDPWLVAARLFAPCYIGGWSAAEYWDLTEQIFRTVVVVTAQRPRDRRPRIKGTSFLLRSVYPRALFGLKAVWRGSARVDVADPARTILDMLDDPSLGGGLRPMTDVFRAYLASDKRNLELLLEYGDRLGNGAVFKRLGFLLELYAPDEKAIIEACRSRLTSGNAKLDPRLAPDRLITRWRLWVPDELIRNNVLGKAMKGHDDILTIGGEVSVSRRELVALLKRFHIKRLALFGSAARGELSPQSDIDVLVEFEEGKAPSMGGMVEISHALSALFGGRRVDVATPSILKNPYRRRQIEKDMEVLYAA